MVTVNYRLGALGFLRFRHGRRKPGPSKVLPTSTETVPTTTSSWRIDSLRRSAVVLLSQKNPKDTVDCLKGVESSRLVQTLASFSPVFQQPPNVFLPQFGRDDLIPLGDPFAILDGRFNYYDKKDAFLAYTTEEGSYLLTVNNPDVFGVFGEKDTGIDDVQAKSMMTKFLENFPQPDVLALPL
ncbi:hypothetical protein JTE90_018528 [Oedothorax gibbosus]|uniref:Uncharacterized protein n=1 Tax=Oedothorax gibbosus TaxID=931172 RepID=A0AAV6THD4_9ARAC|nr:hypothetical protein JTE90_018528 [Oedothorax gibbosus]